MAGGTYTLLVEVPEPATVTVGALGEHRLPAGWYAYTGSALGPGGFARVERHREVAAGERDVRQWHVDHLLGLEPTAIRGAVTSADADVECAVARALPDGSVDGFGASDCDCPSHLAHAPTVGDLVSAVARAHLGAREP